MIHDDQDGAKTQHTYKACVSTLSAFQLFSAIPMNVLENTLWLHSFFLEYLIKLICQKSSQICDPQRHQLIKPSHLFQADAGPLDQRLESGDRLVLPQQEGVEWGGQVSVPLVGDHVDRSEASVFGLAVTAVDVALRRHTEGHEHLRDLLDELQLVGELGQLLRKLDEVIVDVHETQVSLRGDEWEYGQ